MGRPNAGVIHGRDSANDRCVPTGPYGDGTLRADDGDSRSDGVDIIDQTLNK
jgi:hypothetical protein